MTSFSTHNTTPNLSQLFPYPDAPWKVSPPLLQRAITTKATPGSLYRQCVVLPSDPEGTLVWEAVYRQKPAYYGIKRVSFIYHQINEEIFKLHLNLLERSNFTPNWSRDPEATQRMKIIDRWEHQTNAYASIKLEGETFKNTRVLPLFHGFDDEHKRDRICEEGFEIIGTQQVNSKKVTDDGFFGKGIYFAFTAQYAHLYCKNRGHLFLALVSTINPYPVVKADMKVLRGKGNYDQYKAHYIPVVPRNPGNSLDINYDACTATQLAMYDEVVVFQKAQTLPRFLIELQPDRPFTLSTLPQSAGELLNHVFQALQQPGLDNELQSALKTKGCALIIVGDQALLSNEEEIFYKKLVTLFKTTGTVDQTARFELLQALADETSTQAKNLQERLQSIEKQIQLKNFGRAWTNLLISADLFIKEKATESVLKLLQDLLPTVPWSEKASLFKKIIHPLRIADLSFDNRLELEKSIAGWFTLPRHKEFVDKELWLEEIGIPALEGYARAHQIAETFMKNAQHEFLYEEESRHLTSLFFDQLLFLDEAIDHSIRIADQIAIETHLQTLAFIRNTFCYSQKDLQYLVPFYEKIASYFHKLDKSFRFSALPLEGQTASKILFPKPYTKIYREHLKSWTTAFVNGEMLSKPLMRLPSKVMEEILKLLQIVSGLNSGGMINKIHSLSPEGLFASFCLTRSNETKKRPTSFIEFAFLKASSCEDGENIEIFLPAIKEGTAFLSANNSSLADHEKLYRILSIKPLLEPLRRAYLEALGPGEIFNKLADIPNRDGFRISTEIKQKRLWNQIEAITQTHISPVVVLCAFTDKVRYLREDLIGTLLDLDGNIEKQYKGSLHAVSRIQEKNVDLHLKLKPSHSMLELAIFSLASRLTGRGVPPSELVVFEVNMAGKKTTYPVLISETVRGRNLKEVLAKKPPSDFDQKQLTEMLLLNLLIRPGDGRAANFIVTDRGELYSIDNDASFVMPIEKAFFGYDVNFCSILHCLDRFKIDKQVLKQWSDLSPELILSSWIEELIEKENRYASLFSKEQEKFLYQEDSNGLQFTPKLILRAGAITTLYTQFRFIQKINKNVDLDNYNILKYLISLNIEGHTVNIGEYLCKRYEKSISAINPNERLKIATARKQEGSFTTSQTFVASLGKSPTFEEVQGREMYSLEKLKEEFSSFSLLGESGISIQGLKGSEGIVANFINITKDGQPDIERQNLMLSGLALLLNQKTPLRSISILNCSALTSKNLTPFLHPKLSFLDLSFSSIKTIPSEIRECALSELYLTHSAITHLEINGVAISLPSLKTLHISNCENLESIQIEAPYLKDFKSSKNPKLSKVILKSNLLTFIDIDDSPNINRKSIFKISFPELQVFQDTLSIPFCEKLGILINSLLMPLGLNSLKTFGGGELIPTLINKTENNHLNTPKDHTESKLKLTNIDIKETKALIAILPLIQLSHLCLEDNLIGDEIVKHLQTSIIKIPLSSLSLDRSNLSDKGMKKLSELLPKSAITHLSLSSNHIGPDGATDLSLVLRDSKLLQIDLHKNHIGPKGTKAIAVSLSKCGLTHIDLSANEIGLDGAIALSKSLPSSSLTHLYLGNNALSDKGLNLLAKGLHESSITHLHLGDNHITDDSISEFTIALTQNPLKYLNLRGNSISNKGANDLSKVLSKTPICHLDLELNNIDNLEDSELLKQLSKSCLTHLNLSHNKIGDNDVKALAMHLPDSLLSKLELANTHITDDGAKTLVDALQQSFLVELDLHQNKIQPEVLKLFFSRTNKNGEAINVKI